jgi:hypothetical protein
MFGDIGDGVIGKDGKVYIQLDPTFLETVTTVQYQVFLQRYGEGDLYVKERHESYFIVNGTPGLAFGWEIKARQRDYENYRLENKKDEVNVASKDYCSLSAMHIKDIMKERGVANESSNVNNNLE